MEVFLVGFFCAGLNLGNTETAKETRIPVRKKSISLAFRTAIETLSLCIEDREESS